MEPGVLVFIKFARLVVYYKGWILHCECPGSRDTLCDVLLQSLAFPEWRVVKECWPNLVTHFLIWNWAEQTFCTKNVHPFKKWPLVISCQNYGMSMTSTYDNFNLCKMRQMYWHYSFWTSRASRRSSSGRDQLLPPSPWQHDIRGADHSAGLLECGAALLT